MSSPVGESSVENDPAVPNIAWDKQRDIQTKIEKKICIAFSKKRLLIIFFLNVAIVM